MSRDPVLWTVGHSNHEAEAFLTLLDRHRIDCIVDVRSYPYSRFQQFNREELAPSLKRSGIGYLFLGLELGGRPAQPDHFDEEGHALYGKMALEPRFTAALDRVIAGTAEHRIALMCSCGKPRDCHRRLLIGKVACDRRVELRHILPEGSIERETSVRLETDLESLRLFGDDEPRWRSTQSVSQRRRLSTSSLG